MLLLEMSISPLDQGEHLSQHVAEAIDIVDRSGLPYQVTAMGTLIEGEWEEVFAVVRQCYDVMRRRSRRISISIKVDAREGPGGRLVSKIDAVERRLGRNLHR
jgi:uncharacterized protein (TIGR00106 family)